MGNDRVSVIVCTKDAEETLTQCLESIFKNDPFELIIVDGRSKDGTVLTAENFTNKIFEDPGRGLGLARNIGLDNAAGDYIFYVGPDNVLPEGTIAKCIESLQTTKYVGVTPCTLLQQPKDYLSKCLNFYKMARFFPGEKDVIGTPWFYDAKTLKKYRFDPVMGYSDDTDLCERLRKDGYKVAMIDWIVYEIGQNDMNSIRDRWKMYGISDSDFYNKYAKDWGLLRKFQSWLHPLKVDFLQPLLSSRISFCDKVFMLPFLGFITTNRYIGWYQHNYKKHRRLI